MSDSHSHQQKEIQQILGLVINNKTQNILKNINCSPEELIEYINLIKKLVLEKYNVILHKEINILT